MNPKDSVLVVIDVINLCCSSKSEVKKRDLIYKKIRQMTPKLVEFIEDYKKLYKKPVIYVKCIKWDKDHVAPNIRELYKDPRCIYYTKDETEFSEEFYDVNPKKDDIIITKNSYDAFTNPELDKLLKKMKIKNIIITGVLGDGCVDATIKGGFSKGYNFIILKDLIETMDNKNRQKLQSLLKEYTWPILYGKIINSKELLIQ